MGLGKQAKTLNKRQSQLVMSYLSTRRNTLRNQVIFLLSFKAGLRAKEIANITWSMILNSDGEFNDFIEITDAASKGSSGRIIPLNSQLKLKLLEWHSSERTHYQYSVSSRIIRTERSNTTSPQTIVNMFYKWYTELGFIGCSSHSGRRTFITNAAKKISLVSGSLRDVQFLAGHSSLQTTQRYIEGDSEARRKIINLI